MAQEVWALYRGTKRGRVEVFPAVIRHVDPLLIEYSEEDGGGWEILDSDERIRQRGGQEPKPMPWIQAPFVSTTYEKCPIQKGKDRDQPEYCVGEKVWTLFKASNRTQIQVLPAVVRHTNPIVVQSEMGWEILGKKEKLKRIQPRKNGQPTKTVEDHELPV